MNGILHCEISSYQLQASILDDLWRVIVVSLKSSSFSRRMGQMQLLNAAS
jgi:hypothetical protein